MKVADIAHNRLLLALQQRCAECLVTVHDPRYSIQTTASDFPCTFQFLQYHLHVGRFLPSSVSRCRNTARRHQRFVAEIREGQTAGNTQGKVWAWAIATVEDQHVNQKLVEPTIAVIRTRCPLFVHKFAPGISGKRTSLHHQEDGSRRTLMNAVLSSGRILGTNT